jgi:enediyne biosynthesis protein E4
VRRSRALLAVISVVVAVALTACGDDGETGAPKGMSTTKPTTTNRTVPSSRPPTIGDASACYRAPRDGDGGRIEFRDDTEALGLVDPLKGMYGHVVAAGDVNGDGWTDLFVGHFADRPDAVYEERGATGPAPDRLLIGGPDGFRVDETFPGTRGRSSGAAFADLDGDGDLDLVIARNVNDSTEIGRSPSVVLRNDSGRFEVAGELDDRRGGRSVGVFDYDGDGLLDLFLVEDRFAGGSSALFRNDGNLEFSDVTRDVDLPEDVDGLGVATADLDADGRPDLFVGGSNRLFVNVDGERFREIDNEDFRWRTYGEEDDVAGVATGDVDGDGAIDLVVGQHYNSTLDDGRSVPVHLYLNDGGEPGRPRFRDVTEDAGLVGLPTKAPHVELVDFDADGVLDILTTASADDGERPAVFRGLGVEDGVPRFEAPGGLGNAQYWVTGATGDFDHDGRLDVFLVDYEPARPSLAFGGDSDSAHWLAVAIGDAGSGGVGGRVEVYRTGGIGDAGALIGSRHITANTGFGGGSVSEAWFGLAGESRVDVRVQPPLGEPIDLLGIDADQLLVSGGTRGCGA